jgi:hypothetical protein
MTLQHIGVFELAKVRFDHAGKDQMEKISDFLLSPMRILFGSNYTVNQDKTFTLNPPDMSKKVAAVAGLILGGVVVAPLVGVAIAHFSSSRSQIYEKGYRLFWVNQRNQLHISDDELNQVKELIKGNKDHLPRAFGGKTRVWLPQDHSSIVIKASGSVSETRAVQMHTFKEVLRTLGIQNIVVPQCHVAGKYQIESRLPINTHDYHNIRLYIENTKAFDSVIKELVKLASRYWFTDFLSTRFNQNHPLSNLAGGDGRLVRYDNFPVYLENGVAKIALVDLEAMGTNYLLLEPFLFCLEKLHKFFDNARSLKPIETLVRIFPYHRDLICSEARKNLIFYSPAEVEKAYSAGMISINKGYIEFRDWLKAEGKLNAHSLTFGMSIEKYNQIVREANAKIQAQKPDLSQEVIEAECKQAISIFVRDINEQLSTNKLSESATEDEIIEARSLQLCHLPYQCDLIGDLFVKHKLLYSFKHLPDSGAYNRSLVRL